MNKFATAFLTALLVAGFASVQAATLSTGSGTGTNAEPPSFNLAPVSITQNLDTATLTAATMVHCGYTGFAYHTPNGYFRRFQLFLDHSIVDPFTVLSVDYGVQQAVSDSFPDQPVDIITYSIPNGMALLLANLTMLDTQTDNVAPSVLEFRNLAVGGVVTNPVADDLVVEIFTADGLAELDGFWPGGNSGGQTGASYIITDPVAGNCGLTEITNLAAIGFPDAHLFMIVNGDAEPDDPTPTVESSWSQLKGLY